MGVFYADPARLILEISHCLSGDKFVLAGNCFDTVVLSEQSVMTGFGCQQL